MGGEQWLLRSCSSVGKIDGSWQPASVLMVLAGKVEAVAESMVLQDRCPGGLVYLPLCAPDTTSFMGLETRI